MALFSDNGGIPDTILAEQNKHDMEQFPYCCSVIKFQLKISVPVIAGQTYWVAAILPKHNQDTTYDVWNYTAKERKPVISAYYHGESWELYKSTYGAFAVYGE